MLSNLRHLGRAALFLLLALALPCAQAADRHALDMGIFPYLSTRALLDLYQPMRVYLSNELREPVNLFTAPSFKTYTDQTQQGIYDILVTPPHFARLAQREAGYIPLVMYTRELRGIVVVARDSPLRSLQDLKGKRIATPDQLALVTIMGQQLLRDNGLVPAVGVTLLDVTSHTNAVLAVLRGEADAAITEHVALLQMPPELRNGVRIIAQTPHVPHVMYLAHARLGKAWITRLKAALLRFPGTADGRVFLKESGFGGMRAVQEADLKNMDPYIKELKHLLDDAQP